MTVLDFNQDGWFDIATFDHQRDGDHTAGTNIYWGAPGGYIPSNRRWIPTFGVHFGDRRNLGNIYDRAAGRDQGGGRRSEEWICGQDRRSDPTHY